MTRHPQRRQRGGFMIGLIVGLLIGLGLALGVALYVTKAPNPFITKVAPHSPVQDAAEAERNRNWNPNAPLAGKNPAPSAGASASVGAATAAAAALPQSLPSSGVEPAPRTAARPVPTAPSERDPGAILGDRPVARAPQPFAGGSSADPFRYFVQAGAYSRTEEAERQKAKLAMMGMTSRLSEREQAGHTVFRVRVGPFDRKDEADAAKERLSNAGIDAALVRVQK